MIIEIDKPVIPQFVADWIEQLYGQGFNSDDLLEALFSRNYEVAELKTFEWFTDDKERAVTAILYGYEVEQPLYYAKIKGWELTNLNSYWNAFLDSGAVFPEAKTQGGIYTTQLTKQQWNELGINDTNADFEVAE